QSLNVTRVVPIGYSIGASDILAASRMLRNQSWASIPGVAPGNVDTFVFNPYILDGRGALTDVWELRLNGVAGPTKAGDLANTTVVARQGDGVVGTFNLYGTVSDYSGWSSDVHWLPPYYELHTAGPFGLPFIDPRNQEQHGIESDFLDIYNGYLDAGGL